VAEPALLPERSIIDPHLHLWEVLPAPGSPQAPQRFLLHDAVRTIADSGHQITHTIFVECHAMYRQTGAPEWRSLGETEFATGMAAMSASGGYGPTLINHRIIGSVDLCLGAAAEPILQAHLQVSSGRLCGIRQPVAYSANGLFGAPPERHLQHIMLDKNFREGAGLLARLGLSLDAWCLHTQLDDLVDLARALPELTIVLDHVGTPESQGIYAGRPDLARQEWLAGIRQLAQCPNVHIKLGGLGMETSGPIAAETGTASSDALSQRWRPYIEPCIEMFSPRRCMFESNFPPDKAAGSYGATWNAFKRIAAGCSDAEITSLFRDTAARVYRIEQ
jgi:L-fuconolactonase